MNFIHDKLIVKIIKPEKCISKAKKNKILNTNKYPNIKQYIKTRYNDSNSFNETINRMLYGGPEIVPKCPICDKKTIYKYKNLYTTFCSHKCQYKSEEVQNKREQTCLSHNGVRIPAKNKIISEKIKKTNLQKYGATTFAGSSKWKDFIKEHKQEMVENYQNTCLEKYGVKNFQQSQEYQERKDKILEKRRNTNKEKYGEISYAKTKKFRTKIKNKMPSILEKMQKTCEEKYGVKWYFQSKEFLDNKQRKEKVQNTCRERYGVDWFV